MVVDVVFEVVGGVAGGAAFVARAPLAEVIPGEDSVLVAVVPVEADGVIADRGNFVGSELRLVHLQRGGGFRGGGLAGLAVSLVALFVTRGAGTGGAQVGEGVGALVAVFPGDFHGGASGFVDLDGGRLGYAHSS